MPCEAIDFVNFFVTFTIAGLGLQVRNPEFGDTQLQSGTVSADTMMSGLLRTARTKISTIKISLSFRVIGRSKAVESRDFMVTAIGKPVTYVDFDGVSWLGLLTVSSFEVIDSELGISTFQLTFEGSKL